MPLTDSKNMQVSNLPDGDNNNNDSGGGSGNDKGVIVESSTVELSLTTLYDPETGILLPEMQDRPLQQMAVSGGVGFTTGYLVRTFGRIVITSLGSLVTASLLLNKLGYLDTRKMQQDAMWGASVVQNNEAVQDIVSEGRKGLERRARSLVDRFMDIARKNAKVVGPFVVGMLLGLN